jgi:pimeloyl-ACP methyl ester carboxylesterase
MKLSKRNWFRLIWFTAVTIFFVWQWSAYQSRGVNSAILNSDNHITVVNNKDQISFINRDSAKKEIIFFPGGLVDPKSYAPMARKISENGYNVHLIKMPWRMATKGYNKIKELFNLTKEDKTYVLGGHSQGGKMAAQFVYENPDLMAGLYLLGTSHPRDIDMSNISIPTIKIYAEHDGLASVEEVKENENKLPKNRESALISGGNHAQFGHLGTLFMDGTATITREEQQALTLEYLLNFLNRITKTTVQPES